MKSSPVSISAVASILVLVVVGAAFASQGRDFAGPFALGTAASSNGQVMLNFSTRIYNYSGADVSAATVTLQCQEQPNQVHAAFNCIAIAATSSVKLYLPQIWR